MRKLLLLLLITSMLLCLCACYQATAEGDANLALTSVLEVHGDYTLNGLSWGANQKTVSAVFDSVEQTGQSLLVQSLNFAGQAVKVRFDFTPNDALNNVTIYFENGFDKDNVISVIDSVLGERDYYYSTSSGDLVEAPEDNRVWHTAESVSKDGMIAPKYLVVIRFEEDLSEQKPVLVFDATGYNIKNDNL